MQQQIEAGDHNSASLLGGAGKSRWPRVVDDVEHHLGHGVQPGEGAGCEVGGAFGHGRDDQAGARQGGCLEREELDRNAKAVCGREQVGCPRWTSDRDGDRPLTQVA